MCKARGVLVVSYVDCERKKDARKGLRIRSETMVVEHGKAAYLEIHTNLQQGKTYFLSNTNKACNSILTFANVMLNLDILSVAGLQR